MSNRHPSHSESCAVCAENARERAMKHGVLFENDLWLVRHSEPPYGVAGWITLQSKRHVAGPGYFSDDEAVTFGHILRHLAQILQNVTSCAKVYIAAMGESYPHFHCHLVPRYADDAVPAAGLEDLAAAAASSASASSANPVPKGWAVFAQAGEAAAGRVAVDASKVDSIVARITEQLAVNPPPPV